MKFGTITYDIQRAKYIPADLLAYYDELFIMGQIQVVSTVPQYTGQSGRQWVGYDGWTFTGVEKMAPSFPGGYVELESFFIRNIKYPESERSERITGETGVAFTVKRDGTIGACVITRSASPALDNEAMRVIRMMPAWEPATTRGVKVEAGCWMEIRWELK
jgi:TonB family protein